MNRLNSVFGKDWVDPAQLHFFKKSGMSRLNPNFFAKNMRRRLAMPFAAACPQ